MFADKTGKNLDDLGTVFEAFDDSEDIANGFGEVFHRRFGGIESAIELGKGMFNFLEKKNNLYADDGGNRGKNGNGNKADNLRQGHELSIYHWETMVTEMVFAVVREKRLVAETLMSF